jgi:hypothetical protein
MKRILLPSLALIMMIGLASCKKDFTCRCTVMGDVSTETYTNVKRSEAKERCEAQDALAQQKGGSCQLD